MLIKLIPSPPHPTVLFAITFQNPPQGQPLPPAWINQLDYLSLNELELPKQLHSLDKAAIVPCIVEEITLDVPALTVTCHFIDGSIEEWPLMGPNCLKSIGDVLDLVNESAMEIEREQERERAREEMEQRRKRESEGGAAAVVGNSTFGALAGKVAKHKKQRSLLMTLVASIVPLSSLSGTTSSSSSSSTPRQPSPPPTPITSTAPSSNLSSRALRRRARSALVDIFRQHALGEITRRLPQGGYYTWIIQSTLRRVMHRIDQLTAKAGGNPSDVLRAYHQAAEAHCGWSASSSSYPVNVTSSGYAEYGPGPGGAGYQDGYALGYSPYPGYPSHGPPGQGYADAYGQEIDYFAITATSMPPSPFYSDEEEGEEEDEEDTAESSMVKTPSSASSGSSSTSSGPISEQDDNGRDKQIHRRTRSRRKSMSAYAALSASPASSPSPPAPQQQTSAAPHVATPILGSVPHPPPPPQPQHQLPPHMHQLPHHPPPTRSHSHPRPRPRPQQLQQQPIINHKASHSAPASPIPVPVHVPVPAAARGPPPLTPEELNEYHELCAISQRLQHLFLQSIQRLQAVEDENRQREEGLEGRSRRRAWLNRGLLVVRAVGGGVHAGAANAGAANAGDKGTRGARDLGCIGGGLGARGSADWGYAVPAQRSRLGMQWWSGDDWEYVGCGNGSSASTSTSSVGDAYDRSLEMDVDVSMGVDGMDMHIDDGVDVTVNRGCGPAPGLGMSMGVGRGIGMHVGVGVEIGMGRGMGAGRMGVRMGIEGIEAAMEDIQTGVEGLAFIEEDDVEEDPSARAQEPDDGSDEEVANATVPSTRRHSTSNDSTSHGGGLSEQQAARIRRLSESDCPRLGPASASSGGSSKLFPVTEVHNEAVEVEDEASGQVSYQDVNQADYSGVSDGADLEEGYHGRGDEFGATTARGHDDDSEDAIRELEVELGFLDLESGTRRRNSLGDVVMTSRSSQSSSCQAGGPIRLSPPPLCPRPRTKSMYGYGPGYSGPHTVRLVTKSDSGCPRTLVEDDEEEALPVLPVFPSLAPSPVVALAPKPMSFPATATPVPAPMPTPTPAPSYIPISVPVTPSPPSSPTSPTSASSTCSSGSCSSTYSVSTVSSASSSVLNTPVPTRPTSPSLSMTWVVEHDAENEMELGEHRGGFTNPWAKSPPAAVAVVPFESSIPLASGITMPGQFEAPSPEELPIVMPAMTVAAATMPKPVRPTPIHARPHPNPLRNEVGVGLHPLPPPPRKRKSWMRSGEHSAMRDGAFEGGVANV